MFVSALYFLPEMDRLAFHGVDLLKNNIALHYELGCLLYGHLESSYYGPLLRRP